MVILQIHQDTAGIRTRAICTIDQRYEHQATEADVGTTRPPRNELVLMIIIALFLGRAPKGQVVENSLEMFTFSPLIHSINPKEDFLGFSTTQHRELHYHVVYTIRGCHVLTGI